MKINKIVKIFEDTDKSNTFIRKWTVLHSLVKLLYPNMDSHYYSNKTDNMYTNTRMHYEVKNEDK